MKKLISVYLLICVSQLCWAGGLINKGAHLVIRDSGQLVIDGDYQNKADGSTAGKIDNAGTISLTGNWANAAIENVFSTSSGSVILSGVDQALSGSTTFYDLSKEISLASTLTFQAGTAGKTVITNALTLKGVDGALLKLRSDSDGTQWQIDPQGERNLEYLDVKDSNNVNASSIDVKNANCTDSGNNTNWEFIAQANYTVTFKTEGSGTLSGETTQTVAAGADCTAVTAEPNDGYQFTGWTGDYTGTVNPLTITNVSKNMIITANFVETVYYTVVFKAGTGGTLQGTTSQTVASGGECTAVTAIPDEGYEFSAWSGDYASTKNPLTVKNVTSDMTITANFATDGIYTVVFEFGPGGSLQGETIQTVLKGHDCSSVTAIADDGYFFSGWTGDSFGSQNPLIITNVNQSLAITANFTKIVYYTVNFKSATGGTLQGETTQTVLAGGTCSAVTATPDDGYLFSAWNGDLASTKNPLSVINVTSDMTVTANFAPEGTYTVVFEAETGGSIQGQAIQTVSPNGDCSTVTAVPESGYEFVQWSGDYYSKDTSITIEDVNRNLAIVAKFAKIETEAVLTMIASGTGGSVSPSDGEHTVQLNTPITIVATPAEDYMFVAWKSSSKASVANSRSATTTVTLTADGSVTANFAKSEAVGASILTVTSNPVSGGTTTPSEPISKVPFGESFSISATAAEGYAFTAWTVRGDARVDDPSSLATNVSVYADSVVTANFAKEDSKVKATFATSPEEGGLIDPSSELELNTGSILPINAIPAENYVFIKWQVNGNGKVDDKFSSSTSLLVKGEVKITARFAAIDKTVNMGLSVRRNSGGMVDDAGEQDVEKGETRTIRARSYPGYVFYNWIVSGAGIIEDPYAAMTTLTITSEDSDLVQVTAVFVEQNVSLGEKYPKVHIFLDDSKSEGDRVKITKMPLTLSSFDPETDELSVFIEGNEYALTEETGSFKKVSQGYRFKSSSNRVKLFLNLKKSFWNFQASKTNLINIDNSDGIDIILKIGSESFGLNVFMDELTKFNFKLPKGRRSKAICTARAGWSDMEIGKSSINFKNDSFTRNNIKITNGVLNFPETSTFDPLIDSVTVYVDELYLIVPAGTLRQTGEERYIYQNRKEGVRLKLDFLRNKWSFTLRKTEMWGKVNPTDGIDVYLNIGNSESALTLEGIRRVWLKYNFRSFSSKNFRTP